MDFDAVILGAGPAGYVCAIRLAQLGKRAAVVEKGRPGGTCLNIGCIPSKAFIRAASLAREAREGAGMGIRVSGVEVDLPALVSWKDKVVGQVTRGVSELLRLNKVAWFQGAGRIEAPGRVRVALEEGGEEILEAPEIVAATGSRPVELPAFPFDGQRVWSSTEALSPPFFPERLVVIGGGYVGLELGMAYAGLGSQVTVVEALDGVLPGLEEEIRKTMARVLKKRRLPVLAPARALSMEKTSAGLALQVEHKGTTRTLEADALLVTVGRKPWDGDCGLEEAGVAFDERGFVETDPAGRTSVPGIRAMGDLAGQPMLAHKASAEGKVLAASIAGDEKAAFDPAAIPAVVFTHPEIATVGLTARAAAEAGLEIIEGKFPVRALGRAAVLGALDGFVKIVAQKESRRVLGVHIMGPEASELIAAGALAVAGGLTLDQAAETIQAHPTMAEAIPEAAEAALGKAIHLFDLKRKA